MCRLPSLLWQTFLFGCRCFCVLLLPWLLPVDLGHDRVQCSIDALLVGAWHLWLYLGAAAAASIGTAAAAAAAQPSAVRPAAGVLGRGGGAATGCGYPLDWWLCSCLFGGLWGALLLVQLL